MNEIKNFKRPAVMRNFGSDTGGKFKQRGPRHIRVVNAFISGSEDVKKIYDTAEKDGDSEAIKWFDHAFIFLNILMKDFDLLSNKKTFSKSDLKQDNSIYTKGTAGFKRAKESSNAVVLGLQKYFGSENKESLLENFNSESTDDATYPSSIPDWRKGFISNFYWMIELLTKKEVMIRSKKSIFPEISNEEIPSCLELTELAEELKEKREKEPTPDDIFDLWQALNENKQLNDNVREKLCNECFTELT